MDSWFKFSIVGCSIVCRVSVHLKLFLLNIDIAKILTCDLRAVENYSYRPSLRFVCAGFINSLSAVRYIFPPLRTKDIVNKICLRDICITLVFHARLLASIITLFLSVH